MTVQVIYKNRANLPNKGVFAIFTDENFKIIKNNKLLPKNEIVFLTNILKSKPKKKKIISLDLSSGKTLILISMKKIIHSMILRTWGHLFMIL